MNRIAVIIILHVVFVLYGCGQKDRAQAEPDGWYEMDYGSEEEPVEPMEFASDGNYTIQWKIKPLSVPVNAVRLVKHHRLPDGYTIEVEIEKEPESIGYDSGGKEASYILVVNGKPYHSWLLGRTGGFNNREDPRAFIWRQHLNDLKQAKWILEVLKKVHDLPDQKAIDETRTNKSGMTSLKR